MFKRDVGEPGEVRECAFCDRVWGFVGIGIGAFLIFTGVDLMFNGKLTARMRQEISADDMPEDDSESAEVLTVVPDAADEEGTDEDDDDD